MYEGVRGFQSIRSIKSVRGIRLISIRGTKSKSFGLVGYKGKSRAIGAIRVASDISFIRDTRVFSVIRHI